MKAGTVIFEYNIELITSDHNTGEILDKSEIHNAIVDDGLEHIAKLINGVSAVPFVSIAIGTDDTEVQVTDSSLGAEVAKETATATYEASNKAKWSYKFVFGSGESYTITEVGVFAGTVMLNRALDAGKEVDADTDITVNVVLTVARAV